LGAADAAAGSSGGALAFHEWSLTAENVTWGESQAVPESSPPAPAAAHSDNHEVEERRAEHLPLGFLGPLDSAEVAAMRNLWMETALGRAVQVDSITTRFESVSGFSA
jgi:hypothetical protein